MKNPIKQHREKQGLKQLDLGLLLGVSEMTLSHWERGARHPPEEMITRLAEIFKIDPQTLKRGLVSYFEQKQEDIRQRLSA